LADTDPPTCAPPVTRPPPLIVERPPSTWGGPVRSAAGRAVSPFRPTANLTWRCSHGGASVRGGRGRARVAGGVGAPGGGGRPVLPRAQVGRGLGRGAGRRSVRARSGGGRGARGLRAVGGLPPGPARRRARLGAPGL